MTLPKVSVRDLHKRYDGVHAARGVTFEIREGEIFGLIGPNGAGKTTTVECVIGLREPDAGDIEVCGIDARRRPQDMKQKIGAALQTTALQEKITPREALALFGSFYRDRTAPETLLDKFGLSDKADRPFDTLSGGQRQRLALALAFVNKPELVFLDEPTAGLDPHSRRELHESIVRMKQDGHTVLLTTHYLDEAEALCDRVAIIDQGRIVATGAPRELADAASSTPTILLWTAQPFTRETIATLPGIGEFAVDDRRAQFTTSEVRLAVAELMVRLETARIDVIELRVQKASLENVFLKLTDAREGAES
jgi:ABC-2 type transport system ATP-binding protein